MKAKSILCFNLAVLMMLGTLVSCNSNTQNDTSSTITSANNTSGGTENGENMSDETARANTKDSLPADLDFDGLSVNIHSFQNEEYDIIGMGEVSGDTIYDAVYYRTLSVAERLNVEIEWADSATMSWSDYSSELDTVIMAGDDAWQIVYAMGNATIQKSRDNLFVDLSAPAYIDYTQPWWWNEAMSEVSFDGQERKYLVGDLALTNYLCAGAYYFNKKLYADVFDDADELYKIVIDGEWTLDKMRELCADVYNDLNGNGVVDNGDLYGLILGTAEDLKHLEFATDVQHYHRDEEGYPVIEYDLERAQLAVEKIYDLLNNTTGNILSGWYDLMPFANGQTLFHGGQLQAALSGEFREMEDDYGIIPVPKLDETQAEYHNLLHNASNFVAIPITCQHIDEVCAVIEAMCAESYRTVVEPFYESAMKMKYSRDSYSGQCIDFIRDATKKNFAYEHDGRFGSGVLISNCVEAKNTNFSSLYASSVDMSNKLIGKTVQYMKENQD